MTDYLTFNYLIYLIRWLASAIVMFVPLYFINKYKLTDNLKYKEYIDLIILQIIGSIIFYKIDKLILGSPWLPPYIYDIIHYKEATMWYYKTTITNSQVKRKTNYKELEWIC